MTTQPVVQPAAAQAPTLSQLLARYLQLAVENPKSTLSAILTSLIGLDTLLLACHCLPTSVAATAFGILAPAKLILGAITHDAAPPAE